MGERQEHKMPERIRKICAEILRLNKNSQSALQSMSDKATKRVLPKRTAKKLRTHLLTVD